MATNPAGEARTPKASTTAHRFSFTAVAGLTNALEVWIDEAEKRAWFLAEASRTQPH
jgi:hypothetical protein